MAKKNPNELVSNRKAFHDYEILEKFEAGIVLKGTEIKSLRNHSASLQEAYITTDNNELWLINSSISVYSHGNVYNHEEKRKRKLLMHKNEIKKLEKMIKEKGLTIIPLSFFLKNGKVKVSIAAARGRKKYDKRAKLKEKEHKLDIRKKLT